MSELYSYSLTLHFTQGRGLCSANEVIEAVLTIYWSDSKPSGFKTTNDLDRN